MELIFDIEADGLLPTVSKFHCGGAIDNKTGKEYWFRPHEFKEFLELLMSADSVIAHNAFGYDIPALKKLAGLYGLTFEIDSKKVKCTKVMSQVLNYRRFGFGHSLKQWGIHFDDHKGDYNGGWEEFNEDMFDYMKQDVYLGRKVYQALMQETKAAVQHMGSKKILNALRSEMAMDEIMAKQCNNGWLFDRESAVKLLDTIDEKMKTIEDFINPQLPARLKKVDGDDVYKEPKYTKAGKLVAHLDKWFQFGGECSVDNKLVWGEFARIEFVAGDIGNTDIVKRFLYTLGWKPDEWNWKKINGQFVKVSAKLTDSSLKPLGEVGEALMEYYTLRSRKSVMEGWFDYIDDNSRLHGDVFSIGTPTFRQTHKIIANLPSGKATLGPEIRGLFKAEKGYKLVSADSAACQLRLLAHYLNEPEFTHDVLDGDIHQKNADNMGCTRNQAKPVVFAVLYGAGAKKVGSILGVSDKEGGKARQKLIDGIPGLNKLIQRVQKIVEIQGYIPGLDDRPIYTESAHKALNYLIQGAESVVMKATVVMIDKRLTEEGIDFKHLLFYHDEHTVEVREDQAERAREIIMECFEEAPKEYGVNIMTCGDCKIGDNYFSVH